MMMRPLTVWSIALAAAFSAPVVLGQDAPRVEGQGAPRRSEAIAGRTEAVGPRGTGLAALERASAANKYLFLFFWRENDAHTASLWQVYRSAMARLADRSDSVAIRVDDAGERPIVDHFGAGRSPLPLVLAVAPNGAVTKGFAGTFDEGQLLAALVSPGTARCLKALQDRKLVVLCVQPPASGPAAVPQGVVAFKDDPGYRQVTEIVAVNAADRGEASFLQGLGIDPRTAAPTTVLLVPPGTVAGKFEGAVTKEQLRAQLASASSGGCAGGRCGPNGCGPR